jgi:NADH dehydrogenase
VQRIDLERGVVTTSAAERSYDQLVIALGSVTTVPEKIPGAREHALVFRSPADAMQLRNRIIDALEGAHQATDEAARRAWLTFVVIGGGDTGTELAATIYDFAQHAVEKEYPWLVDEAIRVVVIESADRLVPLSSKAASERVRASLERRGITVHTGVGVDRIDEQAVYAGDLSVPTAPLIGRPVSRRRNWCAKSTRITQRTAPCSSTNICAFAAVRTSMRSGITLGRLITSMDKPCRRLRRPRAANA